MAETRYGDARRAAGMSTREAAAALGLSAAALRAYERGLREPTAVAVRRMALLYGESADRLIGVAGRPGEEGDGRGTD